ncbi:MAG: hypothetical protein V3U57_00320 [Robiginitomaculum sp.]
MENIFNTFTPSELAEITGLSTTMQRDWRRRGILATSDGHAKFDIYDLTEVYFMARMSESGIGPLKSGPHAFFAGLNMLSGVAKFVANEFGQPDIACKIFEAFVSSITNRINSPPYMENVARETPQAFDGVFIVWANGQTGLYKSFDKESARLGENATELNGPVIVANMEALAAQFSTRLRPFIQIGE